MSDYSRAMEMLKRRNAELAEAHIYIEAQKDEIRYLRRQLNLDIQQAAQVIFRGVFGIRPKCADILALLYATERPMRDADLWQAMYGARPDCDQPGFQNIKVFVSWLRQKMPAESVTTIWGVGYVLSAVGRAACDQALGKTNEPSLAA